MSANMLWLHYFSALSKIVLPWSYQANEVANEYKKLLGEEIVVYFSSGNS